MNDSSSLPFGAPINQSDAIARLQLIRSRRVGPATFIRLLAEHGSAKEALYALPQVAAASGVKGYSICPEGVAIAELKAGKALGFNALYLGDPKYPNNLAESKDPPPVLWTLGDQSLLQKSMIGIVGARNASSLGTRFTRKLTKDLVEEGYCIVSGLARGIDAMAHEAALPHMSIGVQAGGLDVVYPKENAMLHARMATEGLRLTEHPHGLIPQARHFPQRNRIVAGLVQGLIVIEGAARSGSLITAKYAADLGREVMAVPGNPMDGRAAGCNFLIRDGATLVRNAEDVIDCLGALYHAPVSQSTKDIGATFDTTNAMERILAALGTSGVAEDIVIRDTGLPASVVAEQITTLELNGKVERQAGGLLALIK